MIAPLRRWHRRATTVLAIAVPVVFIAAIVNRPAAPVNAELPIARSSTALASRPLTWTGSDVSAALVRRADGSTDVAFDTRTLVAAPDVLVYWFDAGDSAEPPAAGRLLGAIRGNATSRIGLPRSAVDLGGRLVLYSLAHDEVIATSTIDASGGPA